MLSDIEIAQAAKLKRIDDLAHEWGLSDEEFEPYGRDKAKVTLDPARKMKGKLILVTASSGMPAGSGKTTTSIGLAQGMNRLGKKAVLLFCADNGVVEEGVTQTGQDVTAVVARRPCSHCASRPSDRSSA